MLAVEIPNWLRSCASEIASDVRAESVVLFGSRATGHARADSDWDVGVIQTQKDGRWLNPYISAASNLNHDIQFSLIWNSRYVRKRNALGSLAYEIAHDGVLVAGKPPLRALSTEYDLIDTTELTTHLVNTYQNLVRTIAEILTEHPKRSKIARKFAMDSSRFSGDTAKYVTKALCVYRETRYAKTYDLHALAEQLPPKWREPVLALNGDNSFRHTQQHDLFGDTGESFEAVLRRVENILGILDEGLLDMVAKLPREKQNYLLDCMQEAEEQIALWKPRINSEDAAFDIFRVLRSRYQSQMQSLSDYISEQA